MRAGLFENNCIYKKVPGFSGTLIIALFVTGHLNFIVPAGGAAVPLPGDTLRGATFCSGRNTFPAGRHFVLPSGQGYFLFGQKVAKDPRKRGALTEPPPSCESPPQVFRWCVCVDNCTVLKQTDFKGARLCFR